MFYLKTNTTTDEDLEKSSKNVGDSNLEPLVYEASVLPIELSVRIQVHSTPIDEDLEKSSKNNTSTVNTHIFDDPIISNFNFANSKIFFGPVSICY